MTKRQEAIAWWTLFIVFSVGIVLVTPPVEAADLDEVNYIVNQLPNCNTRVGGVCHPLWPSRTELKVTRYIECTGYVMQKAYTLAAQGIAVERMRVAVLQWQHGTHAVLVVDELVLDNMDSIIRPLSEYSRFRPILATVPWRI